MALVFGKAVVDCFLGLVIQAIEILGLKLLEVLWDGVCKGEQAQEVRPTPPPHPPSPHPCASCAGRLPAGVAVGPPSKAPRDPAVVFHLRLLWELLA